MQHPLFLIAIVPDQKIQQEVTSFKEVCAARFGARHAFKSPPHITLIPPFRWDFQQLGHLKMALANFCHEQLPFAVHLHDFDSFAPRVLYVKVEQNGELQKLQWELLLHLQQVLDFKNKNAQRFHPHMTIAHRDLEEAVFPAAWAYFSMQNYERLFLTDKLTLLQHVNKKWEELADFKFG